MTTAKYKVALLIRLPEFLFLSLGKLIRSVSISKYATITSPYPTVYLPTTTVCTIEFVFCACTTAYLPHTPIHAKKLRNATDCFNFKFCETTGGRGIRAKNKS